MIKLDYIKLDYLDKIKLDNKKIFLIIIISIVVIYIDVSFLLKFQIRNIKAQGAKIVKLQTDINALTKDLANMEDLRRKQPKMQEGFLPAKKIITEDQIPALLGNISNIANNNNVKLIKIVPARELKDKKDKVVTDKGAGQAISYLITLDLSCDYHHFAKFINDLENAEEFMAVQEIKMSRDTVDYLRQNVNLVLRTYVKK